MKTHLDLDESTLDQVLALGGFKSKRAAVNAALTDFRDALKKRQLIELRGKVLWEGNLDELRASRVAKPVLQKNP